MSKLDEIVPRTNVVAGGRSRWSWGAEPQRIVHVFGESRDDGLVVRVVGVDGPEFVLLDEQSATHVDRRGAVLADGTIWRFAGGGCGCGSPLKRFDPRRSAIRDART